VDVSDEFDIERTPELVGLVQDPEAPVVDSKGSSQGLSAWVERRYGGDDRRLQWFWTAGVGVNSVDVEDQAGPLAGGGTFDVTIDAGTELVASAAWVCACGSGRFLFEPALRLDQHFADWTFRSRERCDGLHDDLLPGCIWRLRTAFGDCEVPRGGREARRCPELVGTVSDQTHVGQEAAVLPLNYPLRFGFYGPSYKSATVRRRVTNVPGGDPAVDLRFQHGERHRALAEQPIVKAAQVELCTEPLLGTASQRKQSLLADLVGKRLTRPGDIAVDLELISVGERAVVAQA
jgi:hypothetical protein